MVELSPNQVEQVQLNNILVVGDLPTPNILHYDIDIVDGSNIEELAGRSEPKYGKTLRWLRYNNHVRIKNAVFQPFNLFVVLIVTIVSIDQTVCNDI